MNELVIDQAWLKILGETKIITRSYQNLIKNSGAPGYNSSQVQLRHLALIELSSQLKNAGIAVPPAEGGTAACTAPVPVNLGCKCTPVAQGPGSC